ncbi:unnamed protein product [Dovyalis caffra]|uniref:Uncharacterized protein n=1 Tax=Dovyalis caffra TaxID=77055 RepID=A0AAV1SXH9_9ROSI|nr:unnamed protein product [Dovyalis caffra]
MGESLSDTSPTRRKEESDEGKDNSRRCRKIRQGPGGLNGNVKKVCKDQKG